MGYVPHMLKGLSQGIFTKLVLVIFAVSLVGETAHFLCEDHHFSVDEAEFVHHDHETESHEDVIEAASHSGKSHGHAERDACPAAVTMRSRGASSVSPIATVTHLTEPIVAAQIEGVRSQCMGRRSIYRLAPKNSPPVL